MADGPHTFRVRATDPNGTDPTPAVRSFTLRATDAATAGVSGSTLVVTAGSNALDHIRIGRRSGTTFGVSDAPKYESSGAQVVAGAHCTRSRPSAVICHAKKLTGIRVMSGDRSDLVENKTSIHSSILGGTGEDVLYGGGGDDTLTGGPGRDTLYGMSGDDLLLARDGHNDRVHCDAPFQRRPSVNTDRAVLDELPLDANVANCETVTRP
jgi:Ca2+-binding RTX toxin-like protein